MRGTYNKINLYLRMQTILLGEFIVCLQFRSVDGLELGCCYIDLSDVDVVQHNNSILTTAPPPLLIMTFRGGVKKKLLSLLWEYFYVTFKVMRILSCPD